MTDKGPIIKVPVELFVRIEKYVQHSEFETVDEFVGFALKEILDELEYEEVLSAEDEDKLAQRLRALGYVE